MLMYLLKAPVYDELAERRAFEKDRRGARKKERDGCGIA